MSMATAADLVDHYDERLLKDLCSDTDTAVTDLSTDRKVLAALESGEGRLLSACQIGQLYDPEDIYALTGAPRALAVELICGIAVLNLLRRRMDFAARESIEKSLSWVDGELDKLAKGQRVFPVQANLDASVPSIEGPTVVDVSNLNLITSRARGYYPTPGSRLPIGQQ